MAPVIARGELLQFVQRLGQEFVKRGMNDHARRLRLYYLALKHGLTTRGNDVEFRWSEAFVVEWMRTLKVPPYTDDYPMRPRNSRCNKCNDRSQQPQINTIGNLPDGAKMRCGNCGAVWIESDEVTTFASTRAKQRR